MSRSGGQDKQRYINTFIIHAYIYTFKTLNLCLEKKRKEEVEERNRTGAKRTRPAEISAGLFYQELIPPPPSIWKSIGNVWNVKIIVMACKYYHFKSFN